MEGTWTLCMGCGRITPFMSDTGYQVGLGGEKRVKGHEVMDESQQCCPNIRWLGHGRGQMGSTMLSRRATSKGGTTHWLLLGHYRRLRFGIGLACVG